jgi:putative flavoprotein involved in K+ transport
VEDAIVVGAGPAGLAVSWHLRQRGVRHVVLERGRAGETWRSQRWDSFTLNTPTWMSRLPGVGTIHDVGPAHDAGRRPDTSAAAARAGSGIADPGPPDGFMPRDTWIAHLDDYARRFGLPVRTGAEVAGLVARPDGAFDVRLGGPDAETITARSVVVASGAQRVPRTPALAADLPPEVEQLHTVEYRNPAQLPAGAVLVVGSAQSGGQVAEDLLEAGRTVYLSTSRVARVRRRTRGTDTFAWLASVGFFDQPVSALADPALRFAPQPITSGVGRYGHTLSLQWLQERGARLLGRLRVVEGDRLLLDDDLGAAIAFADNHSAMVNRQVAAALAARGLDAALPPLEDDPADRPHPDPSSVHAPTTLDLERAGVNAVIWATGVGGRFDWLASDLLDERGLPRHEDGAMPLPGLFAVGLPWLRNRGSGIVYGMDRDAAAIVERLTGHLAG